MYNFLLSSGLFLCSSACVVASLVLKIAKFAINFEVQILPQEKMHLWDSGIQISIHYIYIFTCQLSWEINVHPIHRAVVTT